MYQTNELKHNFERVLEPNLKATIWTEKNESRSYKHI